MKQMLNRIHKKLVHISGIGVSGMGMIKAWLGQKAASMESAEDGDGVIRRRLWGQQEAAMESAGDSFENL